MAFASHLLHERRRRAGQSQENVVEARSTPRPSTEPPAGKQLPLHSILPVRHADRTSCKSKQILTASHRVACTHCARGIHPLIAHSGRAIPSEHSSMHPVVPDTLRTRARGRGHVYRCVESTSRGQLKRRGSSLYRTTRAACARAPASPADRA